MEVACQFKLKENTAYVKLKRMAVAGLLKTGKILNDQTGVYWLTAAGVKACNSPLSPLKSPVLGTFDHDRCLITLSNKLLDTYPEVRWTTSREIMSERVRNIPDRHEALNQLSKQIPDGIILRQAQVFAVELEFSLKATHRLQRIIVNYSKAIIDGQYTGVFYYCGSQAIYKRVAELADGTIAASRFRVFMFSRQDRVC